MLKHLLGRGLARHDVEAAVARSRRTSVELVLLVEQVRSQVASLDREIVLYLEGSSPRG